jgi:hypothetical protein
VISDLEIFEWMRKPENGIPDVTDLNILNNFREKISRHFKLAPDNEEIDKAFHIFLTIKRPFEKKTENIVIDDAPIDDSWVTGRDRYYWNRLRDYLRTVRKRNIESLSMLDDSSEAVLRRLTSPKSGGRRKGMVVGYVQSGKTANMAALMAKAADEGYKIFIVLGGTLNNLRSQTQLRFIQELAGTDKGLIVEQGGKGSIQTVKRDFHPLVPAWQKLTDYFPEADDMGDIGDSSTTGITLSKDSGPVLAVIKKTTKRIPKLIETLRNLNENFGELPTLIIDDEADAASVNSQAEKDKVTATNREIRKMLKAFNRVTYLGYTATPYANLFIKREDSVREDELGPDLFPDDFVSLLDQPPGYFGAGDLFGLNSDSETDEFGNTDGLPVFPDFDCEVDFDWKSVKGSQHIEDYPSLRRAVDCFLLSCIAREVRGHGDQDMTMLINPGAEVAGHTDIHNAVKKYLLEYVLNKIKLRDTDTEQRFLKVWREEFINNPKSSALFIRQGIEAANKVKAEAYRHDVSNFILPSDTQILEGLRNFGIGAKFSIKLVNGLDISKLEYNIKGSPKRYIVVGGNKLSRGLTLEGLSVSYFLRNPGTPCYDTLMQMGRWFGYRTGYIDLCKIWVHPYVKEYFANIALADEELRQRLKEDYKVIRPRDLPPRIFKFDGMNITSKHKMGAAVRLSKFGGRLEQTQIFDSAAEVEKNNEKWLHFIEKYCQEPEEIATALYRFQNKFNAAELKAKLNFLEIDTLNLDVNFLDAFGDDRFRDMKWRIAIVGSIVNKENIEFEIPKTQFKVGAMRRYVRPIAGFGAFKVISDYNRIKNAFSGNIPIDEGYLYLHLVTGYVREKFENDLIVNKSVSDVKKANGILMPVFQFPNSDLAHEGDYYGQFDEVVSDE